MDDARSSKPHRRPTSIPWASRLRAPTIALACRIDRGVEAAHRSHRRRRRLRPRALAPQDVVLTNGRIHTMDARNTVASVGDDSQRPDRGSGRQSRPRGADTRSSISAAARSCPGSSKATSTSSAWPTAPAITRFSRTRRRSARSRKRSRRAGRACPRASGSRRWAAGIRISGPSIAIRRCKELDEAVPDRPVLLYERFTGPAVTNSLGKKLFDAIDAAAPVHPDIKKVAVADNGAIAAAGFAGGGPSASALFHLRRAADVRGQEAQHARRDDLLGQRRPDRASRPGALPHARTAASEPDPVEPRSVPDVRLVAGAPPRGASDSSACR